MHGGICGGLSACADWWNKVFSVTEMVLEKEIIIKRRMVESQGKFIYPLVHRWFTNPNDPELRV